MSLLARGFREVEIFSLYSIRHDASVFMTTIDIDTCEKASLSRAFLLSELIELRGLRRADIDVYRSWLENAEATHFMESGWRPVPDSEMEAIYKASVESGDTVVFVIADRSSDLPVGVCGLYAINWICRRAEFRILIGDTGSHGRGFGTEAARLVLKYAFDKLNLETVYLGVNSENQRAIRSYEKAGFIREGVRRQIIFRNGRYYDALMMSVLRNECLTSP